MTEHWTPEEYTHFLETNQRPRRDHTQPCETCGDSGVAGIIGSENHHNSAKPCPDCTGRTVTEVKTGRHHRKMVKDANVGVTFDSMTEARRYDWLMAQEGVIHVDVHPIFNLGHGIRYCADFLVHTPGWASSEYEEPCHVEDVKSKRSLTTAFKDRKKIFDDSHPFSPLVVVQWLGGKWVETR